MKTQRLEFTGHDGDVLAARLDMPVGKPAAFALFAHCFTCSKDIPAARRIAQRLASLGIAVLRGLTSQAWDIPGASSLTPVSAQTCRICCTRSSFCVRSMLRRSC